MGGIVPAAVAFCAVGFLYLDLQGISLVHLHLRDDKDVAKIVAMAFQQIICCSRSGDIYGCFERPADQLGHARSFECPQHFIADCK